jgi:hypothetical protein
LIRMSFRVFGSNLKGKVAFSNSAFVVPDSVNGHDSLVFFSPKGLFLMS